MAAGASRLNAWQAAEVLPPESGLARVAVAVSGGLDSTALLHATVRQARGSSLQVHALHVHHGLMPQADAWLAHVAAQCRRWRRQGVDLHFHAHRVQTRPGPGDSVEAWARAQRYQALGDMARAAGCGLVLLAHHRRDQAETVLLQALRGGGPAGLAAMPREQFRQGLTWARPWRDCPRTAIEAYAARWHLAHVQDPSNADLRLARSRLRTRVWPELLQQFPQAEQALAAVASHAAQARAVLDEVAEQDMQAVAGTGALQLDLWATLSPARRANVLRHWLRESWGQGVPETLVQRLITELPAQGSASGASWPSPGGVLRVHRGQLWLPAASGVAVAGAGDAPAVPPAVLSLDLSRPGTYAVPAWGGVVDVRQVDGTGVAAQRLQCAELRARTGGERFQSHPKGVPRSLKKQFQAAGVPAWQRQAPLVYGDGQLVFVPGLGLDARACSDGASPRVELAWRV